MKNKKNSGEMVIEASIVVTLTVMLITVMLCIGMVFYHQTMVSVMANQTASNIAQVYSNSLKDPFTGYIDHDRVYQSVSYTNMKDDAYKEILERKADAFAKYRLKTSSFLAAETTSVDVEVIQKPNELLKSQIIVTIRSKYDVPLVGFFGQDGLINVAASGRADCVDLIEYMSGVQAFGNGTIENVIPLPEFNSYVVTFIRDKFSSQFISAVPVEKGKSIISSNHYTHSVMPSQPTNGNLKFLGWVKADGTPFSAATTVNSNMTVYGSWECTVVFNPTGGSVNPTQRKVVMGSSVKLPTPTKYHYSFVGWYTGKDKTGTQYFDNTPIMGNIELYAAWKCVHSYKEISRVNGNCQTNGSVTYQCTNPQCKHTYTVSTGRGGHNIYSAGVEGYYCYETYYVNRCSNAGCTYTERSRAYGIGQHNFNSRCKIPHYVKPGTFKCSRYGYVPGKCQTSSQFHITCEYCGTQQVKSTYNYGQLVTNYTFWCGTHGRIHRVTGCGNGGSKM